MILLFLISKIDPRILDYILKSPYVSQEYTIPLSYLFPLPGDANKWKARRTTAKQSSNALHVSENFICTLTQKTP